MSRLDIYKKQAKQLVRWHREGNYSIGGRIRGLARYQSLTDREALAREFSPENIAANRPIVDRPRAAHIVAIASYNCACDFQDKRKAHSSTLASERRTRLGSLVASAVAVVPASGVLMVRLEHQASVQLKMAIPSTRSRRPRSIPRSMKT
jgi:hypothetical protein